VNLIRFVAMVVLWRRGVARDLKAAWQQRWERWLQKRIPASPIKILGHQDVFVFPGAWGVVYALLILVTLVTGINYENAMVLASAFLLAALLVLHILQSYQNLAGLRLSFKSATSCFAGERATFEFEVHGCGRTRLGIEVGWLPDDYVRFDIAADEALRIQIQRSAPRRGLFQPGRLLITTAWPFGLVRCWSWLDLGAEAWIYPYALEAPLRGSMRSSEPDGKETPVARGQGDGADFAGLRQHLDGEPMTRIAWKKMAQTGQRLVREFSEPPTLPDWVDFHAYAGVDLETRLAMMCGHFCSVYARGRPCGLILPGLRIEPATGETHRHTCLLALARVEAGS